MPLLTPGLGPGWPSGRPLRRAALAQPSVMISARERGAASPTQQVFTAAPLAPAPLQSHV